MKNLLLVLVSGLTIFWASTGTGQEVLPLYPGAAPGSEDWNWEEGVSEKNMFQTKVVYNVTHPTLTVFKANPDRATGAAVVVCPGGGFQTLSIDSEGNDVAKWLAWRGVTAFVLKYRLVHSLTDDPVLELIQKMQNPEKFRAENTAVIPLAIADGQEAIRYVRAHAAEYDIDPDKIGIMGFSAGGTVTMGATLHYDAASRPDFAGPVYAAIFDSVQVPSDAPPMFVVAATDDNLGLAPASVHIYEAWRQAGKPVELHMYEKGGHGFGMRKQMIPTDQWIDRFGDWLHLHKYLDVVDPNAQRMQQDWAFLHRYDKDNAMLSARDPQRIVLMGNSITEGWSNLDPAFFKDKPYVNRGISGQTTPQMLLRFRQDVLDLHPRAVVILAGINDIAENTGPMTLEQTFGNLQSMTALAQAAGIQVVLCSVLPAFDFPWHPGLSPSTKVVELNKMIKAFAEQEHLPYVDYFTPMVDHQLGLLAEYTYDGVHPNQKGYEVMGKILEQMLARELK
ncbi:MAG: alpha/beta hydrolase fold domain-containing protein [Saprospiraceae bacterium]|nr:alpha/beta hydrolase fold domain-containing protein [Saprospiraceae bacterium]MCB9321160.1 alpha/beta hydrolase fold domain-containing protein [Lewinellaceae bacterium]